MPLGETVCCYVPVSRELSCCPVAGSPFLHGCDLQFGICYPAVWFWLNAMSSDNGTVIFHTKKLKENWCCRKRDVWVLSFPPSLPLFNETTVSLCNRILPQPVSLLCAGITFINHLAQLRHRFKRERFETVIDRQTPQSE